MNFKEAKPKQIHLANNNEKGEVWKMSSNGKKADGKRDEVSNLKTKFHFICSEKQSKWQKITKRPNDQMTKWPRVTTWAEDKGLWKNMIKAEHR